MADLSPISRLNLALETGIMLFVCAGAVAGTRLWKEGASDFLTFAVALSGPAVAAMLFVLLVFTMPALIAPGRIRFPLNVTLPIVYTLLIVMVAMLVLRVGSGLSLPNERLRPISVWSQWNIPLIALVAQVVALSAFAVLRNDRR